MKADGTVMRELLADYRLPYKVVPLSKERPTPAIVTDRGDTYSAEELVVRALEFLDNCDFLFVGAGSRRASL
jgi:hypothetical protein